MVYAWANVSVCVCARVSVYEIQFCKMVCVFLFFRFKSRHIIVIDLAFVSIGFVRDYLAVAEFCFEIGNDDDDVISACFLAITSHTFLLVMRVQKRTQIWACAHERAHTWIYIWSDDLDEYNTMWMKKKPNPISHFWFRCGVSDFTTLNHIKVLLLWLEFILFYEIVDEWKKTLRNKCYVKM